MGSLIELKLVRRHILSFLIIVQLSGCIWEKLPPEDDKFKISNRSNGNVYSYATLSGNIEEIKFLVGDKPMETNLQLLPVMDIPRDSMVHIPTIDTWNNLINSEGKDSTITIYFFSKKEVDKEGWPIAVLGKKYLRKIVLKESDLDKANWIVTYP